MMKKRKMATGVSIAGYSLVGMGIMLTLIGIMLVSGLQLYNVRLAYEKEDKTGRVVADVQAALDDYARQNGRLPCPASLTAQIDTPAFGQSVNCTGATFDGMGPDGTKRDATRRVRIGAVPVRELGISDRMMVDAWNHRLVYAVTEDLTAAGADLRNSTGQIEIRDPNNNEVISSDARALYVLMSQGRDRRGAYDYNGFERAACGTGLNCGSAGVFVNSLVHSTREDDTFTPTFAYRANFVAYRWRQTPVGGGTVEAACAAVPCGMSGSVNFIVECVDRAGVVQTDETLCAGTKPAETQSCPFEFCRWNPGPVNCAPGCGASTATIESVCLDNAGVELTGAALLTRCDATAKPANTTLSCVSHATCSYVWTTGSWSACSAVCEGTRTRTVRCVREQDGTVFTDSFCAVTALKPATSESCGGACPPPPDPEPEGPPEGQLDVPSDVCFLHVSGIMLAAATEYTDGGHTYKYTKIGVADEQSHLVGKGNYASTLSAFPKAMKSTFDSLAIGADTRIILYEHENFQGKEIVNLAGPRIVDNALWKGTASQTLDGLYLARSKGVPAPYDKWFSSADRVWSDDPAVGATVVNMHQWGAEGCGPALDSCVPPYRSIKVLCGSDSAESSYKWITGDWGVCNGGAQTRTLTCLNEMTGKTVPVSNCDAATRPATSRTSPCETDPPTSCPMGEIEEETAVHIRTTNHQWSSVMPAQKHAYTAPAGHVITSIRFKNIGSAGATVEYQYGKPRVFNTAGVQMPGDVTLETDEWTPWFNESCAGVSDGAGGWTPNGMFEIQPFYQAADCYPVGNHRVMIGRAMDGPHFAGKTRQQTVRLRYEGQLVTAQSESGSTAGAFTDYEFSLKDTRLPTRYYRASPGMMTLRRMTPAPLVLKDTVCVDDNYHWLAGEWTACSGSTPPRTRVVECVNRSGTPVAASFCPAATKPSPIDTSDYCASTPPDINAGCFMHVSGVFITDHRSGPTQINMNDYGKVAWKTKVGEEDVVSEIVGEGKYGRTIDAFPKAMALTFDSIVLGKNTRVTIFSEENFKGSPVVNLKGPIGVYNWGDGSMKFAQGDGTIHNWHPNTMANIKQAMGATFPGEFQVQIPPSKRVWSDTVGAATPNMHKWGGKNCNPGWYSCTPPYGSVIVQCGDGTEEPPPPVEAYHWSPGDWGTCTGGYPGQKTRTVTCRDAADAAVADSFCNHLPKPGTVSSDCPLTPGLPAEPEPPRVGDGCFLQVSGTSIGATSEPLAPVGYLRSKIGSLEGGLTEFVGAGAYTSTKQAFPNAMKYTFDAMAVGPKTRVVIYERENFQGKVIVDLKGPRMVSNAFWRDPNPYGSHPPHQFTNTMREVLPDPYQAMFPNHVRVWSDHALSGSSIKNMHLWGGPNCGNELDSCTGENRSVQVICDGTTYPVPPPPAETDEPTDTCFLHVSAVFLGNDRNADGMEWTKLGEEDHLSEFVGRGKYARSIDAFPKAMDLTFDSLAIGANTRLQIWSQENFKGPKIVDVQGPALIYNAFYRNDYGTLINAMKDRAMPAPYEVEIPRSVRMWSDDPRVNPTVANMMKWGGNSCSEAWYSCTAPYTSVEVSCDAPSEIYTWHEGNWGSCSGSPAQKTRTVRCMNSSGTFVNDSYCTTPKPSTVQGCPTSTCFLHLSGSYIGATTGGDISQGTRIGLVDAWSELVGTGVYETADKAFPKSMYYTFDSMAIGEKTKVTIYEGPNKTGNKVYEGQGPVILYNAWWKGRHPQLVALMETARTQTLPAPYQAQFPAIKRLWSDHSSVNASTSNMHKWGATGCNDIEGSCSGTMRSMEVTCQP